MMKTTAVKNRTPSPRENEGAPKMTQLPEPISAAAVVAIIVIQHYTRISSKSCLSQILRIKHDGKPPTGT